MPWIPKKPIRTESSGLKPAAARKRQGNLRAVGNLLLNALREHERNRTLESLGYDHKSLCEPLGNEESASDAPAKLALIRILQAHGNNELMTPKMLLEEFRKNGWHNLDWDNQNQRYHFIARFLKPLQDVGYLPSPLRYQDKLDLNHEILREHKKN